MGINFLRVDLPHKISSIILKEIIYLSDMIDDSLLFELKRNKYSNLYDIMQKNA